MPVLPLLAGICTPDLTSHWRCFCRFEVKKPLARGGRVKYAIVIERAGNNYSAYAPDVPGCAAVGDTLEEVQREMQEALEFHIAGLREAGLPIPEPTTDCGYVEIAVY